MNWSLAKFERCSSFRCGVMAKTGSATQPGPPPVRGTWATWRRRSSSIPLSTPLWRTLFFWSCLRTIQVNLGSSWSARSPCRRRLTTVDNWRPSTTDDSFNAEPALTSAPAPTLQLMTLLARWWAKWWWPAWRQRAGRMSKGHQRCRVILQDCSCWVWWVFSIYEETKREISRSVADTSPKVTRMVDTQT